MLSFVAVLSAAINIAESLFKLNPALGSDLQQVIVAIVNWLVPGGTAGLDKDIAAGEADIVKWFLDGGALKLAKLILSGGDSTYLPPGYRLNGEGLLEYAGDLANSDHQGGVLQDGPASSDPNAPV